MLPHLQSAYALARYLTRHPQDAEDRVQEAYVKAYEGFSGYAGGSSAGWLLAIVRNTCLTWLKRRGATGNVVRFDEASIALDARASSPGFGTPPDEIMLGKQARDSVSEALFELPMAFREAIVLREFADLSYAQIAQVAGVPIGTVMSRISRGRKLLRELLTEEARRDRHSGM